MIGALVFDAFGTLFDVESLAVRAEALWPGRGRAVCELWRSKQLEYSWLQTIMGMHQDFDWVSARAYEYALGSLGLVGGPEASGLIDGYASLPAFPEVPGVIETLDPWPLAILSNASPATLYALVSHSRLSQHFAELISAEECRAFKPDPRVYRLAVERLKMQARDIVFVSSNSWDAAGAAAFGLRSVWINRHGAPPDWHGPTYEEVDSLTRLPALLARLAIAG